MQLPPRLTAEVLINLLIRRGFDFNDFRFLFESSFRRNYLDDVRKIDQVNAGQDKPSFLVYLNRDGMYDKLPEGLFHRIDRFVKPGISGEPKSFRKEFEQQKNEVIYARKFFQPIENEFFRKRVQRESLLFDNVEHPFKTIYKYFFSGKSTFELNEEFTGHVTSFLPALRGFRGNIAKIKFFLMAILQTEVSITRHEVMARYSNENPFIMNILGKATIGMDFCAGNEYTDHCIRWDIVIEVQNNTLHHYIEDNNFNQFFRFVKSHLIPAEVETELIFRPVQPMKFKLQSARSDDAAMYLGYNIRI